MRCSTFQRTALAGTPRPGKPCQESSTLGPPRRCTCLRARGRLAHAGARGAPRASGQQRAGHGRKWREPPHRAGRPGGRGRCAALAVLHARAGRRRAAPPALLRPRGQAHCLLRGCGWAHVPSSLPTAPCALPPAPATAARLHRCATGPPPGAAQRVGACAAGGGAASLGAVRQAASAARPVSDRRQPGSHSFTVAGARLFVTPGSARQDWAPAGTCARGG